jgi:hypothetical protein
MRHDVVLIRLLRHETTSVKQTANNLFFTPQPAPGKDSHQNEYVYEAHKNLNIQSVVKQQLITIKLFNCNTILVRPHEALQVQWLTAVIMQVHYPATYPERNHETPRMADHNFRASSFILRVWETVDSIL